MNKAVNGILTKVIVSIFLVIILLIIGLNIMASRGFHSLEIVTPEHFNSLSLLVAIVVIALFLSFRKQILVFFQKISNYYVVAALLIISVLLQLLVVWKLNVTPSWDFGTIVRNAKILVDGNPLENYFVIYPNNILLVCILAFIGKLATPDLLTFQLVNIFIITSSQYLIFRIATKIAGRHIGVMSLLFSAFFFPFIFFSPVVYTDTVSLIFLLFPLNMLINKEGKLNATVIRIVIASIIFSLGMILKGSLIIFVIAFSIVLFMFLQRWKKLYFILPFIILVIVKLAFNFAIYESGIIDKKQVDRYSFPVTHWIFMAQNEQRFGKYATEDFRYTHTLLETYSRERVTQIHIKQLKKRITEKGIEGNIKFNLEKLTHTWTDPTYYSLNKIKRQPIHPENFSRLIDYKSGKLLQGFGRVQHIILIFGLLLSVLLARKNEFVMFAMLSIIGFFFFLLIWETRSRYLVSLTPLMIILSCLGYAWGDRIRLWGKKE